MSAAYRTSFFPVDQKSERWVRDCNSSRRKCNRWGRLVRGSADSRPLVRGRAQTKTPVLIRRPRCIRPWQHVLEPLHGYMLLAERLLEEQEQFASSFNFGPRDEDAWPVERIATAVATDVGEGASWVHDDDPGVHEAHYLDSIQAKPTRARNSAGSRCCRSLMPWNGRCRGTAPGATERIWPNSHFQINQYEAILLKVNKTTQ